MKVIITSQVENDFNGSDDDVLYKLSDGSFWVQASYKYWYHCEYRPTVDIVLENNQYFLCVRGQTEKIEVRQVDVLEGQILGPFTGWQGNSEYKLTNGMIFKQLAYKYEYNYSYSPDVLIYETSNGLIMDVDGCKAQVVRVK